MAQPQVVGPGGAAFGRVVPLDGARVAQQFRLFEGGGLDEVLNQFRSHANNVLTFPVFDHVERSQSPNNVLNMVINPHQHICSHLLATIM